MIDAKTKLIAIIGDPVEHSMSPAMHNAAFQRKGLNYAYLAFRVSPKGISTAIRAMRAMDFAGYSVTVPHKVAVMRYLDSIDPVAKKIGAVNTIVNKNGKLYGYNTDVLGAGSALKKKTSLKGKRTVLLGAGGAARAVGFALKEGGASITVLDLSKPKAKALSRDLHCSFAPLKDLYSLECEIFINATPVGMHPSTGKMPLRAEFLRKGMVVFDVIYNPIKTKLLKTAARKGCTTISGLDMFLAQGAAQFKLWTGRSAPLPLMEKILKRNLVGK